MICIMRIIAGKHKGRQLFAPQGDHARPTADMVKQAMFTKLQFFVADASVLDLFAGSGAIGIEAISRGAKQVVFVDQNPLSTRCILQNLQTISESATVLQHHFLAAITQLKGQQFDLIVLDPPYNSQLYTDALNAIASSQLLAKGGIIVCEHSADYTIKTEHFDTTDIKKYGTKKLTYLTEKNNETI